MYGTIHSDRDSIRLLERVYRETPATHPAAMQKSKLVSAALCVWFLSAHLAHTVSSGLNNSTLLVSAPTSAFVQGALLHTFQGEPSNVYSIVDQGECSGDTFSIGRESGDLTLLRTIDFSSSENQLATTKCFPSSTANFVSIRTFYCLVVVQDAVQSYGITVDIEAVRQLSNDDLTFSDILYQAYVVEGVSNIAILGPSGLQAMTLPTGGLTIPNYRITGDSANMFRIELQESSCQAFPVIVVSTPLSRLEQDSVDITVEAFTSSAATNTTVHVTILDTNDQLPIFVQSPSVANIREDATPGTGVVQFQASDTADQGLNGLVRYSISPASPFYAIHTLTGFVYLFGPQANYSELSITASDQGSPMRTSLIPLTVFIDAIDTFQPDIHVLGQQNVSELDGIGSTVANIEVRVRELTQATLELVYIECDCFQVSSFVSETSPGVFEFSIELTNSLDYETFPEGYHVVLIASDDGDSPQSTSLELEITVEDENEPPVFPQPLYSTIIAEGVPVDTEVIRVEAMDPDLGLNGQVTYSMSVSAFSDHFSIHSSSGAIATEMPLDFETFTAATLFIVAADSSGAEASAIVVISILDTNEHTPSFSQTMYTVQISETHSTSVAVFTFSATDADRTCAGAVSYSILHAEPDAFRLDSFSGQLYPLTNSSLDFESFQMATVVVEAMDLGERWSLSSYATLIVMLTEENDEPPIIDPFDCPCFITENQSGQTCALPSARDADSSSLTFSISAGNDLGRFTINSNSGEVSTIGSLDREEQDRYVLSITASDGELTSQPQSLSVVVMDVNDSPPTYSEQTIALTVPQNLVIGDFVANVGATHLDAGYNGLTEHSFSPAVAQSVTNTFNLDPLSGDLYVKQVFANSQYSFTVVARDLLISSQSASVQVTISINGQKNNPPQFPLSLNRVTVPQNLPINSPIVTLSATDPDSGSNGALSYSIVSGASGLFTLTSAGGLLNSQSLSSAVGNEYHLNISVTDSGVEPLASFLELVVGVYPSTIIVNNLQLVHETSVGICSIFNGRIPERSNGEVIAATLQQAQDGVPIIYSILEEGEFHSAFRVENFNVITENGFSSEFNRALREAFYLTLQAQYGSFFHLCSVTVEIEDTNDQPPRFEASSYTTQVYSNTPIGSSIFQAQASDSDVGSNAVSVYSLEMPSVPFAIGTSSGVLTVTGMLSEERYQLTVEAQDSQDSSKTATATIEVNVLQTLNNPPAFSNQLVMFTRSETSSVGTLIHTLLSTDPDSGIHGDNTFCIASGNEHNVFRVDPSGQIFVHNQLDFEAQPNIFNLEVFIHDESPNFKTQQLALTVTITDANDETPQFTVPVYNAVVSESVNSGSTVIRVTATDRDAGMNGEVRYSLVDQLAAFSIDPSSGTITTTNTLNREAFANFVLNVSATDQAGNSAKSSFAEVRIKVLDENDNDPMTTMSVSFSLPESTPVGSELHVLAVTDTDEGANGALTYRIQSGNDDSTISIDPWSGAITLQRSLDFETNSADYVLLVLLQDLGTPPRSTFSFVTFTQEDSNDNYPIFTSALYNCSISEVQFADFENPCQVTAIDNDSTDNVVQYSILSGNFNSIFAIDPGSGRITRQGTLDREARPSYVLQVRARDSSSTPLTSTAIVLISVTDDNDRVPEFETSEVVCPENLPLNTLLFFLHAIDDDEGEAGSVSYRFIGGGGSSLFEIDTTTGAVFLTGTLDYEAAASHTLTATASNPDGTSGRTNITIQVKDINENTLPPFFPSSTPRGVSIPITLPPSSHIAAVRALDPNDPPSSMGSIEYFITGGSGYGYFEIDRSSGNVSVARVLTGLEEETVTLEITAQDGGPFSLSSSYFLTVILEGDPNAKPFFTRPVYYMRPSESATAGIIGYVIAEVNGYLDPLVCYGIVAGNDEEVFSINSTNGAISLVAALDRELTSVYNLTVQAFKPSISGVTQALVVIQPVDENDFRPSFPVDFSVSIYENHPTGQGDPFMRVFARDEDLGSNSQLSYSILQNPSSFPVAFTSPSSGLLYLTSPPQSGTTAMITVEVSDQLLLFSIDIVITVVPAPSAQMNSAPVFSNVSANPVEVREDRSPGELVAWAQATDMDSEVLMYQILSQPTAEFEILPNSGEVYLVSSLDFETRSLYSLIVNVWDGASNVQHILIIAIVDVNDNQPMFNPSGFSLTVTEHSINGSPVGTIFATDSETAGVDLIYSVVDSLDPLSLSLFDLSSNQMMVVTGDVDREQHPFHVLTISCRDSGEVSFLNYVRVTITVIDSNDNNPEFVNPLSEVYVPEDTQVGTAIYTIVAYDPDAGTNAELSYNLQQTNSPFEINSTNGEIIFTSSLDAEIQQEHVLSITVSNPSNTTSFEELTLTVYILDVLDSNPVLLNPGLVIVLENQPIYTLVTSIADPSNLRPVYYTIVAGNELGHFIVEPITGVLRNAVVLDRETVSLYELTIQGAFEIGYETNISFFLTVEDENDMTPEFSSPHLTLNILENSSPQISLGVTDQDSGSNAQISDFLIQDSFANKHFTVDSSGNLMPRTPLDREELFETITFNLIAIDSGTPQLFSSALVTVNVLDTNDNFPEFELEEYTAVLSVPSLVGQLVVTVAASDPDVGSFGEVVYAFGNGGNGTGIFAINSATGEVTVTDIYQLQPQYSLIAVAMDGGGQNTSVSITVLVKECGFNNLLFVPRFHQLEILENISTNAIVYRATDFLLLFDQPLAQLEYSLSLPDPVFAIDTDSGRLSIALQPDRETSSLHRLVLQAQDVVVANRIAQVDIEVTVLDVNDNAPEFEQEEYFFSVLDATLPNTVFNQVTAVDADEGENGEVSYVLISDPSSSFSIDETTGSIKLTSSLVAGSSYTLVAEARDNGNPQLSSVVEISILVVDSNAPRFTNNSYSVDVAENTTSGSVIITVSVIMSLGGQVTYRIETDDFLLPFLLNPYTGDITVEDPGLDYESNSSYVLNLLAFSSTASSPGLAILEIQVLDVNDLSPVFDPLDGLYVRTVSEDIAIDTNIVQIIASDGDSAPNAQITYEIAGSEFAGVFSIDQQSGCIFNRQSLDFEEYPVYRFDVLARDSGLPQRTSTANVRISTMNVNDNPPLFEDAAYSFTVLETASPATPLGSVRALDTDGDSLSYNIVSSAGSSNFNIDSNGLLQLHPSTVNLIGFEMIELNVSASDGSFTAYATVSIIVQDENDPPMFNQTVYSVSVVEPAEGASNVFVAQVFATDPDVGTNADFTYSLTSSDFVIGPETGVITTNSVASSSLDREREAEVTLIVIARDAGGLTGSASVVISVEDINDNTPQFDQEMYFGSVQDRAQIDTPVLIVGASDRDAGENRTLNFTLVGVDPQLPFRIDSESGEISVAVPPLFMVEQNYTFNVSVQDMGTPPLHAANPVSVTIFIDDPGMDFTFVETYNLTVSEDIAVGDTIVTVGVNTSLDCLIITFEIVLQTPPGQLEIGFANFTVGTVTAMQPLDIGLHNIIVRATCITLTDQGRVDIMANTAVTVTVVGVNHPPEFNVPTPGAAFYVGMIAEDDPPFTLPSGFMISANDSDTGDNGTVLYRLIDGDPFRIFDPTLPEIRLVGTLDRENISSYMFDVEAYDGGSPSLSAQALVAILVTDVNDSPPIFDQRVYQFNVPEDVSPNNLVGTVTFSDADSSPENRDATLSITSMGPFSISSGGEITTVSLLDRENQDFYMLDLRVTDGETEGDSAVLMVNVTDVNDNAPVFMNTSQYENVLVFENHTINEPFLQVSATDIDIAGSDTPIQYTIIEQPNPGQIVVNSTTGEISFAISPDFETAPRLEFVVEASDVGQLRSQTTVRVELLDVNDNAPVFTQPSYTGTVCEEVAAGGVVAFVEATDADSFSNGRVNYAIVGGGTNFDIFGRIISANATFDRETTPFFDLTVVAFDSGNPVLSSNVTVHIDITDKNDLSPQFANASFSAEVSEAESPPYVILTLAAEDGDEGTNADITYRIVAGDNGDFALVTHPSNGSVSIALANELDHERTNRYEITLRAIDGGFPAMVGETIVIIEVLDENDNSPMFFEPQYSVTVPENATVNSVLLTVEAMDRDTSDTQLIYSITGESFVEIALNNLTGEIIAVQPLDFETLATYEFEVSARDQNESPRSGTAQVTIFISDINDNPPSFQPHSSTYTVTENNQNTTEIVTLAVTDEDTVSPSDRATFSIESGNDQGLFNLTRFTGVLTVAAGLDREDTAEHRLVITASDNGDPSLTATTAITILVGDVNDNDPTGGHQVIYLYLFNGMAPEISLGQVFVNDSDINNAHTYDILDSEITEFTVLPDASIVVASASPAVGTYELSVRIQDAGNDPAVTTINVLVREVSEETLANSFSMQFASISPQTFVDDVFAVFISVLKGIMSENLFTDVDIQIFAISSSIEVPGNLDITVAAQSSDGGYIDPNLVQHFIHINRDQIEASLNGARIVTELVDLCAPQACPESDGGCRNTFDYSVNTQALGSQSTTYLGLLPSHSFLCERSTRPCNDVVCVPPSNCLERGGSATCVEDCQSDPCRNGGKCIPQNPGYYCVCLDGYDGRNCEQTGATFTGQSYALFESITSRVNGTISLEFSTSESNGLIFFNGRFDDLYNDYIALEIFEGQPYVSFGGEFRFLRVFGSLSDEVWHRLTVQYDTNVSYGTLHCY